jgi:DNA repair protein RAD16
LPAAGAFCPGLCLTRRPSPSLDNNKNKQVIASFTSDPGVRVFLMSLKAGGVALNLTAASHCFVMDSWWNPGERRRAVLR